MPCNTEQGLFMVIGAETTEIYWKGKTDKMAREIVIGVR